MSNLPNPTPQGQAIIEAWNTQPEYSLMVNALAGCGKTTFLQQLAPHVKQRSVLGLAFNKKNAEDLAAKLPPHWTLATMNSIGHRALAKAYARRLNVEANKSTDILKKVCEEWGIGKLSPDEFSTITTLIRMAKSNGLMPSSLPFKSLVPDNDESWEEICDMNMLDFNNDTIRVVREVLVRGIKLATQTGLIDYDDQIYMSVLCNGAFEKYEVVVVDEAQDLSRMNHIQLQKSLNFNGRFVVVGDPRQAIYAFRGASSKSMGEIKALKKDKFLEFPLSLTFRCPKVVVERNQEHAPGFEAAPSNLEGTFLDFRKSRPDGWSLSDLPAGRVAILCRNNAPLLSAAFRLIRSGTGVTMLGRDIGKNLVKLMEKICGTKKNLPLEEVVAKIRDWAAKEIQLAILNGKEEKLAQVEDRAGCLLAIAEGSGAENLGEMISATVDLFEDQSGLITLGTGHRAKGMEWPVVVHLDPWRLPSKHARNAEEAGNPGPMEQELNLKYVIETRSQDVLVNANLKDFVP